MDPILFFVLPAAVATGSAMICYVLMQARMDVAVEKERTERAHIQARLEMVEEMMPERLKAVTETAQRRAFDQLMQGFRVEERRYIREAAETDGPAMVLQERLYYRNMPLSNWIEHELPSGSTASVDSLSVFNNPGRLMEFAAFPEADQPHSQPEPDIEASPNVPVIRRGPQLLRARARRPSSTATAAAV
ncbi:MAG: hypothetical protein SGI92_06135 [Bryobacteraceae bacterium]|nr:hypothetical protein [Bryobacteraceae bacterium]